MSEIPLITVFTPTYNRKETLENVYGSLLTQTFKDFVWQIIDDGSTDDTEKLVNQWISDDKIPIEYVIKENSGKTAAINLSMDLTYTPYWICLDSDDIFVDDALEKLSKYINVLDQDPSLYGLIGLRYTHEGVPMQGKLIPEDLNAVTQLSLRYQHNISPEYYQLYKMAIIKEYKYPEIANENYFPLSYVPNELDQNWKLMPVNEKIMLIDYQDDGITKNKNKNILKNPIGYTLFKHQMVKYSPTIKVKLISLVTYNSASLLSKKRFKFENVSDRVLVYLTFPLGVIDYLLRFILRLNLKIEKVNIK